MHLSCHIAGCKKDKFKAQAVIGCPWYAEPTKLHHIASLSAVCFEICRLEIRLREMLSSSNLKGSLPEVRKRDSKEMLHGLVPARVAGTGARPIVLWLRQGFNTCHNTACPQRSHAVCRKCMNNTHICVEKGPVDMLTYLPKYVYICLWTHHIEIHMSVVQSTERARWLFSVKMVPCICAETVLSCFVPASASSPSDTPARPVGRLRAFHDASVGLCLGKSIQCHQRRRV